MRYLVTLKPLEPFMFGGQNTFGALGDKEDGTYIIKSNLFPQQTTILGMLQHEVLKKTGLLTRKRRGEWVDKQLISRIEDAIGNEKFDLTATDTQNFGAIKSISSVFLMRERKRYIKKADTSTFTYQKVGNKPILQNFSEKESYALYNNYVCLDDATPLKEEEIFKPTKQVGNQKMARATYEFSKEEDEAQQMMQTKKETDDAYFKKISYTLKKGFKFAFYLDYEAPKKFNFPKSTPHATFDLSGSSIVTLGADRGMFRMQVTLCNNQKEKLNYEGNNNELVLLSDSYITLPVEECADFAITSEVQSKYIRRKKGGAFDKSETYYFYEKGSLFINPKDALIKELNNKNLQNIGFNHHNQVQGA